ncbi:mucin-17-like [Stegodyphus dumicola]|uniref:mucin-17-like n=1 Tax=Stegodyphus dumicola TaxID=202533 RepID=UPI0015A80AFE|nr:mucin-17-like [Stegodyphus dumicola]
MGSLAETPEDVGTKDVFLPFDANGKSLSTSMLNLDSEKHFITSKLSHLGSKDNLPRFSISTECDIMPEDHKELSPVEETDAKVSPQANPPPSSGRISIPPISPMTKQSTRSVIKSASVSGLSLIIPTDDFGPPPIGSPGGSSTSSRDASPSRELSPLVAQLKPPIIIRKGPRGYGFTVRAIRVYYGDSDVYTVHHLIMAVENNSPAFESGLRPGDLITHINGEPIQGLLHHQVLHLILSNGDRINIRTIPLDSTTIKSGGRKRNPSAIKMARRPYSCHRRSAQVKRDSHSDKKRRASLLRRLSSKRASAEIHQSVSGSSPVLTPSRSFQSLTRTLASADSLPASPTRTKSPRSPPTARLCSQSDSPHSTGNSSQSSSPSSSVPNSPASSTHLPHFPRPSSLHGLKHKLTQTFHSPRRKSVGHIPLSPLARTPSPSPITSTSPTRSPSPLAFPIGHHPSNPQMAQTFQTIKSSSVLPLSATICSSAKKSFMRPKSAEPSSPLLRRALSPDRLHPKSAEVKAKRESFSGQASPLALSSSPSPRSQYLSHSGSSKLCMASQRSSQSPYGFSNIGKSLTDLADTSSDHYAFQEYESNCTTPKSRLEGRISRSTVSQLRKRGEKPFKSSLTQQLFSSEEAESRKDEQIAVQSENMSATNKLAGATPDIEITSCPSSFVDFNVVHSSALPPSESCNVRRARSESEPAPTSAFDTDIDKNTEPGFSAQKHSAEQDVSIVPSESNCDKLISAEAQNGKLLEKKTVEEVKDSEKGMNLIGDQSIQKQELSPNKETVKTVEKANHDTENKSIQKKDVFDNKIPAKSSEKSGTDIQSNCVQKAEFSVFRVEKKSNGSVKGEDNIPSKSLEAKVVKTEDAFLIETKVRSTEKTVCKEGPNVTETTVSKEESGVSEKPASKEASSLAEKTASKNGSSVSAKITSKEGSNVTEKTATKEGSSASSKITSKEGASITEKTATKEGSSISSKISSKEGSSTTEKTATKEIYNISEKITSREGSSISEKAASKEGSSVPVKKITEKTVSKEGCSATEKTTSKDISGASSAATPTVKSKSSDDTKKGTITSKKTCSIDKPTMGDDSKNITKKVCLVDKPAAVVEDSKSCEEKGKTFTSSFEIRLSKPKTSENAKKDQKVESSKKTTDKKKEKE